MAQLIGQFRKLLPGCVKEVVVRGDAECIAWLSVKACIQDGYDFVFANRRCTPAFPEKGWYRYGAYEYNECEYRPRGWERAYRFVAVRIMFLPIGRQSRQALMPAMPACRSAKTPPKDQKGQRTLPLFKDEEYVYRVFVTNLTLKPHNVIAEYDDRANVENSIAEAQREGIKAIPLKRFQANPAYFQVVMLAYNLWRWTKLVAAHHERTKVPEAKTESAPEPDRIAQATIRTARLRMLYVAAKVTFQGNRDWVYYSIHENRAVGLIAFLGYLDRRRAEARPWSPGACAIPRCAGP